jgi:hypothetical protein
MDPPGEGELAVVGPGQIIYFDAATTPQLKGIIIEGGSLIFDDNQDVSLNVEYLIIVNGVLQYVENWQELLAKIEQSVDGCLFLGHVPVVTQSEGFIMLQQRYNSEMLHYQFNKEEFLSYIKLPMVREFITGVFPFIENAPEQCELRSFLFIRNS